MKYSILAVLSFLALPAIALAGGSQGFVPLVGIPGLDSANTPTFDDYVDALYALAISVAALIAVIQIVIGGAQYMMDDLITSKSAAKERIKNALIGLLIIIAAALILTTINSDLTRLDINPTRVGLDNSRPDPIEYIDSVAEMADEALARNTRMVTDSCEGDLLNPLTLLPIGIGDWFATCPEECQRLGGIMSYSGVNSCTYLQDDADNCNPQGSEFCCAYIKSGQWDSTTSRCSGLEESTAARKEACYRRKSTWDETNDTCRTTACNPNTDAHCCSSGGGVIEGGQCVNGTDQSICEERGDIWNTSTETCTPRVVTDPNNCGTNYLWNASRELCQRVVSQSPLTLERIQEYLQSNGTYDVNAISAQVCNSGAVFVQNPSPACVTFGF